MANVKISDISTTESNLSNLAYLEGERTSGNTPVKLTPELLLDRKAPLASSFTLASSDGNSATLTDGNGRLNVDLGPLAASETNRWAYRTLTDKTQAWEMVAKLDYLLSTQNYASVWLGIQDSISGRCHKLINQSNVTTIEVFRTSSLVTFVSADATLTLKAGSVAPWFKIVHDGTNYKFSIGPDRENWIELYSVGNTSYLTNRADRVGIGGMYLRSTGVKSPLSVPYFSLTGPGV